VALLRALPALDKLEYEGDVQFGVNIIRRAIEEPLRQIVHNGGLDASIGRGVAGDTAGEQPTRAIARTATIAGPARATPARATPNPEGRGARTSALAAGRPGAHDLAEDREFADVVGVVVGHEADLAQDRGPRDQVLGVDGLPCRPCSDHGPPTCPLGHHRCMKSLNVEDVLLAIEETGALHRRD